MSCAPAGLAVANSRGMSNPRDLETIAETDLKSIVGGNARDEFIKAKVQKFRVEHVDLCAQNAMSPYRSQPAGTVLDSCMNTDEVAADAGKQYDQIHSLP